MRMLREEAIEHLKDIKKYALFGNPQNKALDIAIKALEQEPCEDEYIRVPKKALKYRTAGMVAYNAEWLKNNFDIERAVICGAQEPCPNAISRSDMLDAIGHGTTYTSEDLQIIIKGLPSVNPQPKVGYWIDDEFGSKCSCCGIHTHLDKFDRPMKFKHCSMCGAKMVEPQESEGKE